MLHYFALTVLTTVLFLRSFFPVDVSTNFEENDNTLPEDAATIPKPDHLHPAFEKVVFIVIDSLRYDFIQPHVMPETWMNSRPNHGCVSELKAESPTVTLPRIKAMTTGRVPQFLDIVRNLASSEVLDDSWLHSAKKAGKKIVFYGDDTWLKLFPEFFHRCEGTHSFFVTDFKIVDDNVTNNVIRELEKVDWDIMVLHYLGLDHIGHVLGSFNEVIQTKLAEMDQVISLIHKRLSATYKNTLIIVTGDHGMRDVGGHGGSSHWETAVPLVLMGLNCTGTSFAQTDLPANLASLLGLEIPSTSIGKIQRDFLEHLPFDRYLFAMRENTKILLRKKNSCMDHYEKGTSFHLGYLRKGDRSLGKNAAEWYKNCSESIVDELISLSVKQQDSYHLIICLLVFANILLVCFSNVFEKRNKISHVMFLLLAIASFQIFVGIYSISVLFIVFLSFNFINSCYKTGTALKKCKLMCLVAFIQPFTFISSSFIEEEHQYWYFFLNTSILVFVIVILRRKQDYFDSVKLLSILICFRFLRRLNSVGDKWISYPDISDWLLKSENYLFHQIFFVFGLVMFFCYDFFKISQNVKQYFLSVVILTLTFVFKSFDYLPVILPRIIWILIALKGRNWLIFSSVLLLKPYNILLLPFCLHASNVFCNNFESTEILTGLHILLSNCLYFAQGHTNSLASVDVSVGYIGLNDYQPVLVIAQVLLHTYMFPLLCHKSILENVDKSKFWDILISHRILVLTLTCFVSFIQREHVFIWSVFAPKLLIENVHTLFLFLECCVYTLLEYWRKKCKEK